MIVGKLENRKDIKTYKETYPSPKNQDPSRKENNTTNSRNCEGGSKKKKKKKKKKKRKTPEKGYNPHRSEKYGFYLENVRVGGWSG